MSAAQPFKNLEIYDLLGNIVPGATTVLPTIVLFVAFSDYGSLSSTSAALALLVLSLVVGHAVQWLGSELEGTPTTFSDFMRHTKEDSNAKTSIYVSEVGDDFWDVCANTFGLSDQFDDYGVLFQFMLSYLTMRTAGRFSKFQALYAFHRGMYTACLVVIILSILSLIASTASLINTPYSRIAIVAGLALVGVLVFHERKEKFDRVFVKNVITDFYIDRTVQ